MAAGRGEPDETLKIILVQPLALPQQVLTCRGLTGPQPSTSQRVPGAKSPGLEEEWPEVRDASGEGLCHGSRERETT